MTSEVTIVGDDGAVNQPQDKFRQLLEPCIHERIDEDELPHMRMFDLKKMQEDQARRKELAKARITTDSHLLAQVFDSCALQGATGLAAEFGEFWHRSDVCPQLMDYWLANEFRVDKLFVPIDRDNATFQEVIRLLRELDLLAADRKRAIAGYYCCFALFYGQKPKQSAHIEHHCLRHDLDKRIVSKPNYDHAEDYKYDRSVNTAKRIMDFVKERAEGLDNIDAYLHTWKRLAGKNRWWFTDQYSGREWIAVPWL